jgi:hypothetical protein
MTNPFTYFSWQANCIWMFWWFYFAVFEFLGVKGKYGLIPLTHFIRASGSKFDLILLLAWMVYHFVFQSGFGPKYP